MTASEFSNELINLQDSLMRFAYHLTADKDDAKDLVQETLLKALKNCNKFVYESNFKAWTLTIMKNTFINHYRSTILQNAYNNQKKEGYCQNPPHATGADDPSSIFISKELEKTIETLDDNLKHPFKMHHEGFKYKEIAEILDINLGTVKSRIYLARRKLIDQLNREAKPNRGIKALSHQDCK
ncbi:MAG: RNA polymerase sigma factor [Bacteroidales bacterium]|nr:RNA polymerase sigma factor [Bacteroidales bacterium]